MRGNELAFVLHYLTCGSGCTATVDTKSFRQQKFPYGERALIGCIMAKDGLV